MINIIHIAIHILTLVLAVGIIYKLWHAGFDYGAMMRRSYKYIGWGIIFLSLNTLDEVSEHLFGVGSETFLDAGNHDFAHALMILIGFALFARGIFKIIGTHKTE